ncbi:DUF6643 family protein [Streptomyces sp. NPDC090022]|uniref:DUF6643 family protein n=1 Tax=Streptomyces sp. NPDC090022 TaxID=3365920 RepID=UPI0037FBAED7
MTSPRSTYGGGYYSAPSFPDTPIYDSLVAERGTPQIAPIRVPAAYEPANSGYSSGGYLPALPAALPALPSGPSPAPQGAPAYGYPYQQQAQSHAPLQHAPAPYIPQQAQQPRPVAVNTGYEAMRPAAPRPIAAPAPVPSGMTSTAPTGIPTGIPAYQDQYGRQYPGRGY